MNDWPQDDELSTPKHESDEEAAPKAAASLIRVSATSRSSAVAGAIAAVLRERQHAEVQAIGAGAVNQAVKALAIARGYLIEDAIDLVCIPYFATVEIDGQERTAMRFIVEPRQAPPGAG